MQLLDPTASIGRTGTLADALGPDARRVQQAEGTVSAQARCSLSYAKALLHDRARDSGASLDDMSSAVLDRAIRLRG